MSVFAYMYVCILPEGGAGSSKTEFVNDCDVPTWVLGTTQFLCKHNKCS